MKNGKDQIFVPPKKNIGNCRFDAIFYTFSVGQYLTAFNLDNAKILLSSKGGKALYQTIPGCYFSEED